MSGHDSGVLRGLLRKAWRALPFKPVLLGALRRVAALPPGIYKHLHFTGPFTVDVDGRDLMLMHYGFEVENEIFWAGIRGGWERVSMSLWIELSRRSRFIVDVGANTGVYSLVAAAANPAAEVLAFEPVERVWRRFEENLRMNSFPIDSRRAALSNFDGTGEIHDPGFDHIYSVTLNAKLAGPEVETVAVAVPVARLDSVMRESYPERRIDLMKIDVETHEPEVLEGMGELLCRCRPSMLIEVLNEEVAGRLNGLLDGLGYLYFNIDEIGAPRRQGRLTKSAHFNFLVCSPEVASALGLPSA